MKALNFIEAISYIHSKVFNSDAEELDTIEDLIVFYSQEFKPEMITEYFEGWRHTESGYYIYSVSISFWFRAFKYHLYNNGTDDFVLIPKTINDFISDCNRAGIELTWKQEIIDKHFR